MIREHSKYYEFEVKNPLTGDLVWVEFEYEYNIDYDLNWQGDLVGDIANGKYSDFDVDGYPYTDAAIKEKFGEEFLKVLDFAAVLLVENDDTLFDVDKEY